MSNPATRSLPHRGRLQVQGEDMARESSRSWAQAAPRSEADAKRDLNTLEVQCTATELALRDQAFRQAQRYVTRAKQSGGACGPVRRSFSNRNLPPRNKDARVDIEVMTGLAFL